MIVEDHLLDMVRSSMPFVDDQAGGNAVDDLEILEDTPAAAKPTKTGSAIKSGKPTPSKAQRPQPVQKSVASDPGSAVLVALLLRGTLSQYFFIRNSSKGTCM